MAVTYAGNEDGIFWSMNPRTRVLELQGKGAIPDFEPFRGNLPGWTTVRKQVEELRIGEGVTRIGSYAFYPYDHGAYAGMRFPLRRFVAPSSLESIGSSAFRSSTYLGFIDLSGLESLCAVEQYAFASCFHARGANLSGCARLCELSSIAFWGCDELSYIDLTGCFSLSGEILHSLRKETPGHIAIVMPDGELSYDAPSLGSSRRSSRVLLGGIRHGDFFRTCSTSHEPD